MALIFTDTMDYDPFGIKRKIKELKRMRKIQIAPKGKDRKGGRQMKQVRVSDEQHKKLVAVGRRTGWSLTELINIAIEAIE